MGTEYPAKMAGVNNAFDASVGPYHIAILNVDATVLAAGYNYYGELGCGYSGGGQSLVATVQKKTANGQAVLSGITSVAAGSHHTVMNVYEYTGNPTATPGNPGGEIIPTERYFTNTVMSSGYGSYGQMGNDSTSSTNVFPVKALSSDKKTHLTGVAAVAADTYSSAALLKDGTIRAWGYGSYGQLDFASRARSLRSRPPSMPLRQP